LLAFDRPAGYFYGEPYPDENETQRFGFVLPAQYR
jgi:hypothetical protein